MALSNNLHLYLRLERLMMEFDDQSDPFADKLRDLMDPLWFSLSEKEREFLNGRENVDVRVLYPVTLTVLNLYCRHIDEDLPSVAIVPVNGIGKRFALEDVFCCPA